MLEVAGLHGFLGQKESYFWSHFQKIILQFLLYTDSTIWEVPPLSGLKRDAFIKTPNFICPAKDTKIILRVSKTLPN